ncbi:MAG: D-2-hydroxyacid dehydrogenase [Herpetosiphon sp.]
MTQPVRILTTEQLNDEQRGRLRAIDPRIEIVSPEGQGADEIDKALRGGIEILYHSRGDFDPGLAPDLRWMQASSAGIDHLHGTPIWHSDVVLTSANGIHAVQIGEYVMMAVLAHFHRLPAMQRLQLAGVWPSGEGRERLMPQELRGATIGIIGYGAIGRETARLAAAFGMRVLATAGRSADHRFDGWTSPGTGDPDGSIPERFFPLGELTTLLEQSDAVVLSLPLTERTEKLIGSRELAAMQRHALLVNIGRGRLVDQSALLEALRQQRIGGVALDVTDPEPLPPDDLLWALAPAIITPHIAGMSRLYADRAVDLFATNLARYLKHEPLLNQVDRGAGY